ncbi:MAG: DUF1559 domain-containing protein [Planctomycetota bacterium]
MAQEPPKISKAPANAETPVLIPTPGETPKETPVIKSAPAVAPNSTVATPTEKAPFPEAAFLSEDVVGIIVSHPRRIMELPVVQMLKQAGLTDSIEEQSGLKTKPESIERAILVIDQASIDFMARASGFEIRTLEAGPQKKSVAPVKNNLKQLGLAFHNYESSFRSFPRADGSGDGKKTGLSWRVHLLPFLEQQELYQQFHLDEPWDSEHNKTLIEKMPAIFQSPGVEEAGKTAFHVFADENSAVNTRKGVRLADITDGTSNTILAVSAGPDTADFWTKPGGLAFDSKAPKKSLGNVGKELWVVMCDGAALKISADCDDATLANLITINDGNVIGDFLDVRPRAEPRPLMILTFASVDREEFLKEFLTESEATTFDGQSIHKNEFNAVCFVNEKTALCGPIESVKKMIQTHQSDKAASPEFLNQLESGADFSFAFDLKSQASLLDQIVEAIPALGVAQQLEQVALQINLSGKVGAKLLELILTAIDEDSANSLSQSANVGLIQLQQSLNLTRVPTVKEEREALELTKAAAKSATVRQVGNQIELLIPVPEGFEKLPQLMKPSVESAAKAAARAKRMNSLRQFALGFHNYHETYLKFPGAGISADGKSGLSWRVHILPMIGEAVLYQQFNLDEPWDSETNKKLIEKMPKIFEVKEADQGKTSFHLLTGPGAPFADDATPSIAQFTDGTSSTLLVVEAAADTAEIWTKPGGLDFDPKNPIKALGTLLENEFIAVMADGSARAISKSINPETLRRLIQHQDGEAIE